MAQTLQNAQEKLSTMTGGVLGADYKFPAFDELPKVEGMPQGSIWGFYDKNGNKDEVGCKSRILEAAWPQSGTLTTDNCKLSISSHPP